MADLLLACGHSLQSVIEIDGEQVCGACQAEASPEDLQDGDQAGAELVTLPQPMHSVRAETAGKHGCWAVSRRTGNPCGAPAVRGTDYCSAHTGLGLSKNPGAFSSLGNRARTEKAARRAELRLMLGNVRRDSPRAALRAAVIVNAERIAGRVTSAILDPEVPADRAARLGIQAIEAADPRNEATLTVTQDFEPQTMEDLARMTDEQKRAWLLGGID